MPEKPTRREIEKAFHNAINRPLNESPIDYGDYHERMNSGVEKKLRSRQHPLGANPAFPDTNERDHFEEKVASGRFKDIVERLRRYAEPFNLNTRNPHQLLMQMMHIMVMELPRIERPHRKELEKLTIELVKDYFHINDEMDFDVKLEDTIGDIGANMESEDMEIENEDEDYDVEAEVHKRRFINGMISGAAVKTHYLYQLTGPKLNSIDPRLMSLYNFANSANDFAYWIMPDDFAEIADATEEKKAGASRYEYDPETGRYTVIARAKIFPVLIHETVKTVMEVLSISGYPENERVAQAVLSKADFVKGEIWDIRLGPGLWERFIDAIGESEEDIKAHLYSKIAAMPVSRFNAFMKEILNGSEKGKRMMVDLANDIRREIESEEDSYEHNYDDDDDENINIDDIDISDLF